MRRVQWYSIPADDMPHRFKLSSEVLAVCGGRDVETGDPIVEFWVEWSTGQARSVVFQVFPTGRLIPAGAVWVATTPYDMDHRVWHLYEVEV